MKKILTPMFACLMAGLLWMAPMAQQANAQSAPEPAIVVSMAQVEKQLATANYLVDAAGFGQMAFFIKLQADNYLKGIDSSKPMGAMLYFSEESPEPSWMGFVPISNMDDVLNTIADNLGEVDEGDDYTTVITDSEEEVLIKKVGNFAYLTDDVDMFKRIPEDPVSVLGDLPNSYNLSAKVFGQRIPESLRQQAIDMIRDGYESTLEAQGDDSLQSDLQQQNFEMQMKQLESFINETDSLTIGFNADKETGSLYMDVEFYGLEGSEMAKRCAVAKQAGASRFGGFLMKNVCFNANMCFKILPEDGETYKQMFTQLKDEAVKEMEEDGEMTDDQIGQMDEIISGLMDALSETVEAGVVDGGAVVTLDDGFNLAAGMLIKNPGKVEAAVKKAITLAESKVEEDFEVKLNAGSHQGVNFHKIVVPIPEDEEEMMDVFGDTMNIVIGIGKDAVYLGAGSDPMSLTKKAMDGTSPSGNEMRQQQYNLFLAPLLRFAANMEGEEMVEMMAEQLAQNGKDRISVVSDMVDNGMKMRFEMQDGILSLISVAAQSMGQGFAPGNDDF